MTTNTKTVSDHPSLPSDEGAGTREAVFEHEWTVVGGSMSRRAYNI